MKKFEKMNMGLYFCGFLVFIFAPFEMYLANIGDWWFTVYDFGGYLLAAFVLYCIILYFWERFAEKYFPAVWDRIAAVFFFIGLALYIQGNFIMADYGKMDGQPIVWENFRKEGFVSVSLFVTVIVAALILVIKMEQARLKKMINVVAICLLLVQISTLSVLFITQKGMQRKDNYIVTTESEWDYSKEDNFNVVLMDAFDSRVFNELLNGEYGDDIKNLLEDFTYYRNTTTVYNLTDFSVPQILTGSGYKNECLYGEYLNKAYQNSPLLNELRDKGYETNIYSTTTIPQDDFVASNIDNWEKTRLAVSSHRRLLTYMYQLIGFRYLPQPLKQSCWFYPDDMAQLRQVQYIGKSGADQQFDVYDWDNKIFYDDIDRMKRVNDKPVFHFYHIKGIHVIRNLDSNLQLAEDVSLEESAKAMLRIMDKYLSALKENDLYDNSVIIFTADHAANEYEEKQFKQCPLLLVKGKNEQHEFKMDERPVSFADWQKGFHNLLNETNLSNPFEVQEEKQRDRYLYQAGWIGSQLQKDSHSEDFYEFKITGDAFDSDSIAETGKVFKFEEQ